MLHNFRASKIRQSKYYIENLLKQEEIINIPKKINY